MTKKTRRGPRKSATFSLISIQVYLAAKLLKIALNPVVLLLISCICKVSKSVRKGSTCENCVQLTERPQGCGFFGVSDFI